MNTQTHLLIAAALFARPGRPRANAAVMAGAVAPDAAVTLLFVWGQVNGIAPGDLWGRTYSGDPMQTLQAVFNSVPLYTAVLLLGFVLMLRNGEAGAPVPGFGPMPNARATTDTVTPRSQAAFAASERRNGGVGERRIGSLKEPSVSEPSVAPDVRSSHGWWDAIGALPPLVLFALAALVHLAGDLPLHADDAHRHFWPVTDWRFHSPVSYWDPAHHGTLASVAEGVLGVVLCVVLWRRFPARWVRALVALAAAVYVGVPLYWSLVMG